MLDSPGDMGELKHYRNFLDNLNLHSRALAFIAFQRNIIFKADDSTIRIWNVS